VHANASLFKAPEIKRAVQSGQAQIGEVLLVNFENEWPIFGLDGIPFLATGYKDSFKLYQAQKRPCPPHVIDELYNVTVHQTPCLRDRRNFLILRASGRQATPSTWSREYAADGKAVGANCSGV
jgi:hypothetical protein